MQPEQNGNNGTLAPICLFSLAKEQGEELEEGVNAKLSVAALCLGRSKYT